MIDRNRLGQFTAGAIGLSGTFLVEVDRSKVRMQLLSVTAEFV
jgi:hypothetical protein